MTQSMDGPDDAVTFLAASESRVKLLEHLDGDGGTSRRECYESLDVSRRTVKRSLSAFEQRGWVTERDGAYRLTAVGGAILDEYRRCTETLAATRRLAPFLRRVPAGEFDLDPRHLADAEVVRATDSSPYAPMDQVLELRRDATELRELSTVVAKESVTQLADRLADGDPDLDVEVVLSEAAAGNARSNPDYADDFEANLAADALSLYVHDDGLPFLAAVCDDAVALGVTDEAGRPDTLVVSEDPRVREWALARFRDYRETARRLD